jgi:hypothetical protein
MLAALGPRLEWLQIHDACYEQNRDYSLVPAALMHCPVLSYLDVCDVSRATWSDPKEYAKVC